MQATVLEDFCAHWPETTRAVLPIVLHEIVRAIVPRLGDASIAALAAVVGGPAMQAARRDPMEVAMLYDGVAVATGASRPMAIELTQMVMLALGQALSAEARARLERELPAPWGELFVDPRAGAEGQGGGFDHAPGHTLASGHPGADASLVEAAPRTASRH